MTSLYKIYVYCDALDIYIVKHGISNGNLMRPEQMVNAAINAVQFICNECGVELSLVKSKVGIKHIINMPGNTCKSLEKRLIDNRRLIINDFPDDTRLFDYLMEDCEINAWTSHKIVLHACKLLDNCNSEFFMANTNEKTLIDSFDDKIFNSYYESVLYNEISIFEYFNNISI